jgi:hypothetical protein
LNPHALRHWILSPARLPFRHSRAELKGIGKFEVFEGEGDDRSATKPKPGLSVDARSWYVKSAAERLKTMAKRVLRGLFAARRS